MHDENVFFLSLIFFSRTERNRINFQARNVQAFFYSSAPSVYEIVRQTSNKIPATQTHDLSYFVLVGWSCPCALANTRVELVVV